MAKANGKEKGGKNAKTNEATSVKHQAPAKVKGPKADYTPRAQKAPMEVISMEPSNIWLGYCGLVQFNGMRFRVSKEKHVASGHEFRAIRVEAAAPNTPVYGIAGSGIYVTVADIHRPDFRSPFKPGTEDHFRQEKLWNFFDHLFTHLELKGSSVKNEKEEEVMLA